MRYKEENAKYPHLSQHVPFSREWYVHWREAHLAAYPDLDQRSRDSIDMLVRDAEETENGD